MPGAGGASPTGGTPRATTAFAQEGKHPRLWDQQIGGDGGRGKEPDSPGAARGAKQSWAAAIWRGDGDGPSAVLAPRRGFFDAWLIAVCFPWVAGARRSWRRRLPQPDGLTCRAHAPAAAAPARGCDFRAWAVGGGAPAVVPLPPPRGPTQPSSLGRLSPSRRGRGRGGAPGAAPHPACRDSDGCMGVFFLLNG